MVARGRPAYDADEAIRLAGEAVVHRLGEAIARLPDAFIEEFPAMRLKAFKGMRNLVAHRYHDVDYQILWSTMVVDIPELAEQIKKLTERG
ncbi:MAG: HepT-like ribonuclease domain-containing protein [Nakamurella sp.]